MTSLPSVVRTVFIALLIDIFSFTIILPLFPRLLDYYRVTEANDLNSLFSLTMNYIEIFKTMIGGSGSRLDVVLFGGALGSLFSFLQCLVSPIIGRLSDRYGRKRVLMWTMTGNLLSCLLWIISRRFWVFVLSRVVGGISEGNVQLSVAIITDVTPPETRSKGLSLVGIAFALGFTFGPAVGAYFSRLDLGSYSDTLVSYGFNPYSASALLAFCLILLEMLYLHIKLEETHPQMKPSILVTTKTVAPASEKSQHLHQGIQLYEKVPLINHQTSEMSATKTLREAQYISTLSQLARLHFIYLFVFSGLEFTLPFLTFDRFHFSNIQQGKLLGFIGLLAALLQGGYTRRFATRSNNGEQKIVLQGLLSCSAAFIVLALWRTVMGLYVGAAMLALTSATVVTGLTSLASLCCAHTTAVVAAVDNNGDKHANKHIGLLLGQFRSWGQLGRASGPIVACSLYWLWGPVRTYCVGGLAMVVVTILFRSIRSLPSKEIKT